jgi:hypothetical protein
MLYKVSDFRQSGMPVRAVVRTREEAVRVAVALGIDPADAHIESMPARGEAMVDALHEMLQGCAEEHAYTGDMGIYERANAPAEAA